jgi:Predicted membrane protein (DUF2306)
MLLWVMNSVKAVPPALTTRHWLFLALALSIGVTLFTNLPPLFHPNSAIRRYYQPVQWWLIPHALTGITALVTGPFQFSVRLRKSRPDLHRAIGLFYIGAVFVSTPFAAIVTLLHVALVPSLAPLVQGFAWVVATGMAWRLAFRRNFVQHRQWMIRSYALTTTFVSTRLLFSIPAVGRLDPYGTAIIILSAVVVTMVCAEVGIQLSSAGQQPIRATSR